VSFLSRVYPATNRLLTILGNTDSAAWPVAKALEPYLTSG